MANSESAEEGGALFSVPLPSRTDVGWMEVSSADDAVSMPYTDLRGPFSYHFTGRRIDGKAAVTEVSIGQKDPDHPVPIRSVDLRGAPLGAFADLLKSALKVPADQRFGLLAGQARTHVPKLGRSRSAEHFMQVAWVFRNAQLSGDPSPRKAVRDHWQIGEATAKRWLAEVRRRGYLHTYLPSTQRHHVRKKSRTPPLGTRSSTAISNSPSPSDSCPLRTHRPRRPFATVCSSKRSTFSSTTTCPAL